MLEDCRHRAHRPAFVLSAAGAPLRVIWTPKMFPYILNPMSGIIMSPTRRAHLAQQYFDLRTRGGPGKVLTPHAHVYTSAHLPDDCQFWQLDEPVELKDGVEYRIDPMYPGTPQLPAREARTKEN